MRIQRIVMIGLGAGAVALALAGCTETARGTGAGQGPGQDGGQGYRGARYAATRENQEQSARGYGRGTLDDTVEPASDRTGRDVADVGTLAILSGTLATDDGEWYLDAADGRYLLHLGNASYVEQAGVVLEAGEPATVKGIVDADEVSVVSLETDGRTYALRAEDGRPLWAGGNRSGGNRGGGRGTGQGTGRGAGRGAGLDA